MAEIEIPQVGKPTESPLTRERSTLSRTNAPEPVTAIELSGKVTVSEPSRWEKLRKTFIAEDAKDIGQYVLYDIVIPTIRRTIRDVIVGSADRIFLGTSTTPSSLYRDRGVTMPRTNYSGKSRATSLRAERQLDTPSYQVSPAKSGYDLADVIFNSREDAERVLDTLIRRVEDYGRVSVDEYMRMIGRSVDYTAQNWGWVNLMNATITNHVGGGYSLNLPAPVPIYR